MSCEETDVLVSIPYVNWQPSSVLYLPPNSSCPHFLHHSLSFLCSSSSVYLLVRTASTA